MQITILKAPSGMSRWNLVVEYLALRKEVFIDSLEWDLRAEQMLEFEQYDVLGAPYYVICHDESGVLAGCRLLRCDTVIGNYTYMIKDAFDGKIALPASICDSPPPTDKHHWELTRLVSKPRNRKAVLAVMDCANSFLLSLNARGCLCLSSPAVERLARLSGFKTIRLGEMAGNSSGRFAAYLIPIEGEFGLNDAVSTRILSESL